VLGFSQGAATAWRWVTLGRSPAPARLVIWGGEIPDDVDLAVAAERIGDGSVVFVAGIDDQYCPPARLAALATQARAAGLRGDTRTYPGGHDLDAATLRGLG
jgi:predicted esterase